MPSRTHLRQPAAVQGRGLRGFVTVLLAGCLLPGCPLTDEYFVDPNAGVAVSGTGGDASKSGGSGGTGGDAGASTSGGSAAGGGAGSGATSVGGSGTSGGAPESGRGGTSEAGTAGAPDPEAGSGGTAGQNPGCVSEPERCDGISNDCDDDVDEGSVCPDGCKARYHDGHIYVLCVAQTSADYITGDDAIEQCPTLGEDLGLPLPLGLAWIESAVENDFLKDWVVASAPADGVIWIGANDQLNENRWVWGSRAEAEQFFVGDWEGGGTPYMDRFNDWGPGRPSSQNGDDQDCGAFDSMDDWQWNDRACDWLEAGFVCEEHPPL